MIDNPPTHHIYPPQDQRETQQPLVNLNDIDFWSMVDRKMLEVEVILNNLAYLVKERKK